MKSISSIFFYNLDSVTVPRLGYITTVVCTVAVTPFKPTGTPNVHEI